MRNCPVRRLVKIAFIPKKLDNLYILYKVENLRIDELDCRLDFFDPADGRYKYRPKKERKNTDARHSPQSGCDLC